MDRVTEGQGKLSRRQMLSVLGATAAAGVTGGFLLSERSAPARPPARLLGAEAGTRLFQAAYPYDAPPKGNLNLLPGVTESITMGYIYDLIMMPGAMYYWDAEKYFYLLADPSSSLSSDGTTLTYKVRPGLKWSDGNPITAQDVYTTWVLEYILANPAYNYIQDVTMTDSMTVTFHIAQPAPIAQYYILRAQVVANSAYGQFLAQAEPIMKAKTPTTDPSVAKVNLAISSFKPKSVIASGPFNFDVSQLTNSSLTLVRNPNGYGLDKVKFDKMIVWNGTSDGDVMPLEVSKKIDYATYGFTVADVKEFESLGFRVLAPPTYFGGALFINYDKCPEFSDKRARQALAYAINRAEVGAAAEGSKYGKSIKYMTGFSDVLVPKWMSPADIAKLNRYPHNLSKAQQLLKEAGFKKSGGKLMTPQGKPAKYQLKTVSQDADLSANAKSLQTQLAALGIQLTLVEEDGTQLTVDLDQGKYEWTVLTWGSAGNPFPTASFQTDILTYNAPATHPYKGMNFPLQQHTDVVGDIDFATAIPDSGEGPNLDSLKAKVGKVALAFNELLPIIPNYERYGNNPVDTKHVTGWPPNSDPIYKNCIYADNFVTILMYQGVLKPASTSS